jgi:hypothetical protein
MHFSYFPFLFCFEFLLLFCFGHYCFRAKIVNFCREDKKFFPSTYLPGYIHSWLTWILHRRTMKLLPSTALYLDDGTPVAWAFLGKKQAHNGLGEYLVFHFCSPCNRLINLVFDIGPDSSLSSLHCEEPYRGKGIAKAVAVRALRDHLKNYVDDGQPAYGWADVAPDNVQSRGVCRSLKGKVKWQITW